MQSKLPVLFVLLGDICLGAGIVTLIEGHNLATMGLFFGSLVFQLASVEHDPDTP